MGKVKKLRLDDVDSTADYFINDILLLGCDTAFSLYQFAYHIGHSLDIPFQYYVQEQTATKEQKTLTPTNPTQTPQTLNLWEDIKTTEQKTVYYKYFNKKTQLHHYLYKNTSSLFQSSISIKEYEFIRYWWIIKGDLTYTKNYCQIIKEMVSKCPSIMFIELMDINKMSEIPQCAFWE